MLTLLLIVIFFVCFGFLFREGTWCNTIRLINVIIAALIATTSFEGVANLLDGSGEWLASFTYAWDFLALWGIFALYMAVLRGATDYVSKVKVRFRKIHDQVGSAVLAACIGWVMICFTTTSLHTAPLGRNLMLGSFRPENRMFLGLAPDRKWLAFVQGLSRGSFSSRATAEDIREEPAWAEDKTRTFDPRSEFMPKYATRRALLETHMSKPGTTSMRIRSETPSE